jgi:type III secretory pathway component EscU
VDEACGQHGQDQTGAAGIDVHVCDRQPFPLRFAVNTIIRMMVNRIMLMVVMMAIVSVVLVAVLVAVHETLGEDTHGYE